MSLQLMKERMKITGHTPREEMIRDGQNLLKEELEHDSSYSPTMFFYDSDNKVDDRLANLRVYGRKNSSLNGNYMNFLTTYDNPIKIGDYIHDTKDDTYWLVYNSFNVNDVHYEGKLIQCNYPLKWQLSNGKVVERWANIVSASKYDTGETGNATIVLSSNNFTVLIGFCEEGYELEGKRVFIDKRNVNPEKVFKMTRQRAYANGARVTSTRLLSSSSRQVQLRQRPISAQSSSFRVTMLQLHQLSLQPTATTSQLHTFSQVTLQRQRRLSLATAQEATTSALLLQLARAMLQT